MYLVQRLQLLPQFIGLEVKWLETLKRDKTIRHSYRSRLKALCKKQIPVPSVPGLLVNLESHKSIRLTFELSL